MAKEEIIVDSVSGKTREQLHKESEQDYSRKRAEAYALAQEQQPFAGLDGDLFRVDRLYRDSYDRDEILRGVTKEQAMAHCQDPETSSRTTTTDDEPGDWFDGYQED